MNGPRSFEQRLEAWLDEGPASAPPDLLDVVLDSVPSTIPPRRRLGAGRRLLVRSSVARFGAAIAAVLVIGIVGFSLLNSRNTGIGATGPTPTPTASVTAPDATPAVTEAPATQATIAACGSASLAASITTWGGAAGHRIATVELKNTGTVACQTAAQDRPQLVGGNGALLIDGAPAVQPALLVLAPGQKLTTLVQDGNYCGSTPVAPVTVAFVLSTGAGRVVATPQTPTDTFGIPPCNSAPGSAGTIEMQTWTP
jgi:hypothetical protein